VGLTIDVICEVPKDRSGRLAALQLAQ